jgi:hypothetical protein
VITKLERVSLLLQKFSARQQSDKKFALKAIVGRKKRNHKKVVEHRLRD